ncbi:hypothetical protein FHG87_021764 [Trinorchestia longiramus]|nr:hypothetical protein FHG87_021764 [Trinorchestia longiramus]
MHVGESNWHFQHAINYIPIETVQSPKDLGVIVTENLKHDKQVGKRVGNASRILGFIVRNFEYKSKNIISFLYYTLIRSHLNNAVLLGSPILRREIHKTKKIQRSAMKISLELRNFSYKICLQHLKLISIEQRRLRGELIETYKYLNGLNNVTLEGFLRTENNDHKLLPISFNTSQANFFPIKIVATWNQLPEKIVSAGTVNIFKNRVDKYWIANPHHYNVMIICP